jgi:hypothetical protein
VDAVQCLEDEVAVGVGPRVLLGDAALVDQALHERVVAGELADLVVAIEVGAAVADVTHRQPLPVEQRDGRGRAGATECRLVVD